jgi:hypothetical protein
MIWGYPYFRKPLYIYNVNGTLCSARSLSAPQTSNITRNFAALVQKWWELLLVPWKEELNSMDWLKGKSTGNHRFSHEICGLPVFFPSTNPLIKSTRICHGFSWQTKPGGYHRFGSFGSQAPQHSESCTRSISAAGVAWSWWSYGMLRPPWM